ncbi:MAG: response regulator [Chloroflexota bacterium]
MVIALVIDDNRHTADSLCQLLSLFDLDARPAYGPRAAMLALREAVPDIVFLDLNMPGVSGFEVLGFLKREPRLLATPVVVVTAEDETVTVTRALREGALDVIIKPASVEALEEALRKANLLA